MSEALWISERQVVSLLSLPQAIGALREGLREEAAGRATNMVKTHATYDGHSTLHAIGGVFSGRRIVGTKTWTHTDGGACPLLVLFSADDGQALAVIEAFALGQMRTGGISGLGADVMAGRDARRMAMIGAGKQSLAQIAAVAAVRPLDRIAVWSPTPARRERLAQEAEQALSIESIAASTLEEAIDGAEIVTLATRATSPFLYSNMLAKGVHINAVGAITPERSEFEHAILNRADVIAADSVPQVRKLSREFMDAFGSHEEKWARVKPLSDLVAANAVRPAGADLTVFKAMGMGISDVSLGIAILERARAERVGRPIPAITRQAPRLTE